MKKNIYCVRDDLAEVFQPPFLSINDSTAKRDFIDGVSKSDYKNDLALYAIGTHDDATGIIAPFVAPKRLMTGFEVLTEIPDADLETAEPAEL